MKFQTRNSRIKSSFPSLSLSICLIFEEQVSLVDVFFIYKNPGICLQFALHLDESNGMAAVAAITTPT